MFLKSLASPTAAALAALVVKRAVPSEAFGLFAAGGAAGAILATIMATPTWRRTAARDAGVAVALVFAPTAAGSVVAAAVRRTPAWVFGLAAAFAVAAVAARASWRTRARPEPTVAGLYAASTFTYALTVGGSNAIWVYLYGLAVLALTLVAIAVGEAVPALGINPRVAIAMGTALALVTSGAMFDVPADLYSLVVGTGHLLCVLVSSLWAL